MLAHRHVNYSTFLHSKAHRRAKRALTTGYSPCMRIELPSPTWADAHRAQDDAHTLTVPLQRSASVVDGLLAAPADGPTLRLQGDALRPVAITLTL
jgi:hypothetical protein